MNFFQRSKRKVAEETDSSRKSPKLNDASEDAPPAQSPTSASQTYRATGVQQAMDLSTMTADEREKHYESKLRTKVEPLHRLDFASEILEYPALAAEIKSAYLRHTIFSVEVQMNYDTTARRFYYDTRAQDCGRMRLPPKLTKLHLAKHEYTRVLFELCTPFTRLARVLVTVEPTELDLGVRLKSVKRGLMNQDALLAQGILKVALPMIREHFKPNGRTGMSLEDVVNLAEYFCIRPADSAITAGGWIRDTDVWMNFLRPGEHNSGYIDDSF